MTRLFAILSSLLLIGAQPTVVASPVGGGPVVATPGCCCDGCTCAVGSDRSDDAVPVEAAIPAGTALQFVFLPAARVLFELPFGNESHSAPAARFGSLADSQPLFRLKCALLI